MSLLEKSDNKKPHSENETTHFGYRKVLVEEKANLINNVFASVANRYDLMNDLMSFGLHRLWKRLMVAQANLRPGDVVLDVAAGTGDLTKAYAKKVGKHGQVVMSDINEAMLQVGSDRLANAGVIGNLVTIQANAEKLPFVDNCFDCVSISFGLRNVTNKNAALASMFLVLKPGGKLLILEFSQPKLALLNPLYDWYSFHLIPKLGQLITKDETSYRYLVESIRLHPDQETLKEMMHAAGFEDVEYTNLAGGIVALHTGYKY